MQASAVGAAATPDDGGERGEVAHASLFDAAPKSLVHRAVVQVCDTLLDYYAAFVTFALYLFTFETLLLCVLSAGSVAFYCRWYSDAGERLSANINWTFFSFAIVFPLTFSLNEAFKRRELALLNLAQMKSNLFSIYLAHRDWDWATKEGACNGRDKLPAGHVVQVRAVLMDMTEAQCDVLLAPNVSRSRHLLTAPGRQKRCRVQAFKAERHMRIATGFSRLSAAAEELKTAGLPGNEAARLRQYNSLMMGQWETVRNVKRYRTPLTTRVFARLYILLHPFIMGPYYAYIAGVGIRGGQEHTNFAFAVMLAVLTSVALSALFNIRYALEDPFVEGSLDTIRVRADFAENARLLQMSAKGGPLYDMERPGCKTDSGVLSVMVC